MKNASVILLAAGSSKRMNSKQKKQFIKIKNKPLFQYSIDRFLSIKSIDKIFLILSSEDYNKWLKNKNEILCDFSRKYKKFIDNKIFILGLGGKERYDTIYNTLIYIKKENLIDKNSNLLIHDSARPIFDIKETEQMIKLIDKYKAITFATKTVDTIKQIKNSNSNIKTVDKTLNRDELYNIKTPQAFKFDLIYNTYILNYKKFKNEKLTDDLQVIEKFAEINTYLYITKCINIKVTTKADIDIIKSIL